MGKAEQGDTVTLDFSEAMDPCSILDGWSGDPANVVVRIKNDGTRGDTLTVWDASNTTQLPLGSVALNGDPVTKDVTFGVSATPFTMAQSGAPITVMLGTVSSGDVRTDNKTAPMVWSPSASPFDRAGNASTTATASESGALDPNF